jgi:hypothetical protein
MRIAPQNEGFGPLDLLLPSGRLWSRAFNSIHSVRGPIFLGVWGLVLILTAVIVIGGLSGWLPPSTGVRRA